jgi:hypothetical protein
MESIQVNEWVSHYRANMNWWMLVKLTHIHTQTHAHTHIWNVGEASFRAKMIILLVSIPHNYNFEMLPLQPPNIQGK